MKDLVVVELFDVFEGHVLVVEHVVVLNVYVAELIHLDPILHRCIIIVRPLQFDRLLGTGDPLPLKVLYDRLSVFSLVDQLL